jgi:hypothetical protein
VIADPKPSAGLSNWGSRRKGNDLSLADDETLFRLVPIGEENAVPARFIWEVRRQGAPGTVKAKLNNMVAAEQIERKLIPINKSAVMNLYFQKS